MVLHRTMSLVSWD